jgi:8-oxo-dGTP diphosphatase
MPTPPHIALLRQHVGHMTLLTPTAAAVIRDEVGRVLLIRRGDGDGWSLPGGVMEPGERLDQCLVREVQEETGLDVEPVRLIGVYSDPAVNHIAYPNGDQIHIVSATFECRVVGGQPRPDGHESLEVAYFSPNDLPPRLVPAHHVRIQDALAVREAAFYR